MNQYKQITVRFGDGYISAILGADVFGNFTRMDNALEKLPERLAGVKDDLREAHR